MKIKYFDDTDATIDVDAEGNLLALTVEHASTRTDLRLIVEGLSAA
jgi:uncharacterized protein YuzE